MSEFKWYRDKWVWTIIIFFTLLFALNMYSLYLVNSRCAEDEHLMKVGMSGYICVENR